MQANSWRPESSHTYAIQQQQYVANNNALYRQQEHAVRMQHQRTLPQFTEPPLNVPRPHFLPKLTHFAASSLLPIPPAAKIVQQQSVVPVLPAIASMPGPHRLPQRMPSMPSAVVMDGLMKSGEAIPSSDGDSSYVRLYRSTDFEQLAILQVTHGSFRFPVLNVVNIFVNVTKFHIFVSFV